MDLNIDSYSINELFDLLNIKPENNVSINDLHNKLYNKIDLIKIEDETNLPESKEELIEFYSKGCLKLTKHLYNDYDINYSKKENKLLPKMNDNIVVESNNNFVTKHNDHASLNTFNSNLKYGVINPLTRKSYKKVINVNTRFRNNYNSTISSDFDFLLPSPIKKVVSTRLIDIELPNTVYTISSKLGSNSFTINQGSGDINIDIASGAYSATDIVTAVNTGLSNAGLNISLVFNRINALMSFVDNCGNNFNIDFNFNSEQLCPQHSSSITKDQVTLGWILGFRGDYVKKIHSTVKNNKYFKVNSNCCNLLEKDQENISNSYSGNYFYTAEATFDAYGSRYFLLAINDYQNNHNNVIVSPFKYQSGADNNIIAKIPSAITSMPFGGYNRYCERIYFGPTDIAKLHVRLYDEYGRIVDNNNCDYSFTLELEVIYDL